MEVENDKMSDQIYVILFNDIIVTALPDKKPGMMKFREILRVFNFQRNFQRFTDLQITTP